MRWIREKFVEKLYSEERNALGSFVSLCSPFGLWPLDEDNVSLRIRWSISVISMAIMILQAIYEAYLNCVNFENVDNNLNSITFGILVLSKLLFYYKHRDVLRKNIESAVADWSSEKSENFRSIMCNNRSNYKKVTKYLFIVGSCAVVMWIITTLFVNRDVTIAVRRDKNGQYGNVTTVVLPRYLLPATCTFNNVSQSLYWTIIVIQLFQLIIITGVVLSSDGFFIAITSHLCTQFELLKIKFATFPNLNNETKIREHFSILIARHAHLLKLADQLKTAFSMVMLTQIVISTFILNLAGLNFLLLLNQKKVLSAMVVSVVIQFTLGQTFVYCYNGDWLTCQGDDIALSVYHCKWYMMPSSISKNAILVIKRSRFPIGLTAGSFLRMTRSTFTSIVATAASYLSVLRVVIEDI